MSTSNTNTTITWNKHNDHMQYTNDYQYAMTMKRVRKDGKRVTVWSFCKRMEKGGYRTVRTAQGLRELKKWAAWYINYVAQVNKNKEELNKTVKKNEIKVGSVFHNENGIDYIIVAINHHMKRTLLLNPKNKTYVGAWDINEKGYWNAGHYFIDNFEEATNYVLGKGVN